MLASECAAILLDLLQLAALRKNKLRLTTSSSSVVSDSGATFVLPGKEEVSPSSTMARRKSSIFTSEGAKKKWRDLERKVGVHPTVWSW